MGRGFSHLRELEDDRYRKDVPGLEVELFIDSFVEEWRIIRAVYHMGGPHFGCGSRNASTQRYTMVQKIGGFNQALSRVL